MNKRHDYYNDIRLIKSVRSAVGVILLIVLLLMFPIFAGKYFVYVANLILINIIVAVGLNLLVGYTGQISLGHSGFMAVGAYFSVMTLIHLKLPFNIETPFIAAVILSGFVASVIGLVLGFIALRTKGPYLAIVTLGFGIFVEQSLVLTESITGGRSGLRTPAISLFGHSVTDEVSIFSQKLSSENQVYFIILLAALLLILFALKIVRSKVGRAFIAVGDSEAASGALGINVTRYRTMAFAVSAFYVGVAGALHANMMDFIEPSQYGIMINIDMIAMIVVGGLGSIFGSILGAGLLTVIPLLFAKYSFASAIISGAIMIVIVIFQPRGLSGMLSQLALKIKGGRLYRGKRVR
ncbi:MAG: branched-chain amino acid ABC transporter permease [Deltaproteobacteria bacterium]|uniref:Branched-chain amino acid ABC transporter permease n=1 Tax=Candidatus Zymogenus saltonus TaxID=2844893 RepID=A0A9D8KGT0_9DELT|nr:branched-chain amino acid ABC transporter permease [Candidatus Zymogenus saltonus]